jgi:trans-2,3-dihydro-3-hydroxyanthranilate isomerase
MHEHGDVAPLLGLKVEDLLPDVRPQTVSTGLPFCVTVLRTVDALGRMRVNLAAAERYFQGRDVKFFYAIAEEQTGEWRARMQFYNGEDPATGSAAGCAISYLVRHMLVPPDSPAPGGGNAAAKRSLHFCESLGWRSERSSGWG